MAELIEELVQGLRDVEEAFQAASATLEAFHDVVMRVMQHFGEAKKPKTAFIQGPTETQKPQKTAAKPEAEKKVTVLKESDLKKLDWRENSTGSGWYVHQNHAPNLWAAIISKPNFMIRLGEFYYKVFSVDTPFIHKFPVKKKEASK